MFSVETFLLLVLLGLCVGAFGTLVGAGGGFILTPVLLVLYPADSPATITAISLAVVFFNAASGSLAYARQRRIDYRSGVVFAIATLPGAIAGSIVVGVIPRRPFDILLALLLGSLALWLAIGRTPGLGRGEPGHGSRLRELTDRDGVGYRYAVPIGRGAMLSVLVGFVSTVLGIGGGVIHVPLLVEALGFPVHVATATSHFILAIMSGTATVTHAFSGSFAHGYGLHRAAALSVGVVAGAQAGARLSTRLGGHWIRRLLAFALALLALRLLLGSG
ncbi:MAG: sulfite exporter TauE/SafE family protein [Candidatus Dormibacteria bacterium]